MNQIYNWLAKIALIIEDECRIAELSLIEMHGATTLLDLGCGDGSFTIKAATKLGASKIYGIDIYDENILKARAKGIEMRKYDLNNELPFPDGSFDVVLASHVIEHLDNTDSFLSEIHRILKINGYLIMATPNLAAWHQIFLLFLGKQPTISEISDVVLAGTMSPRGKLVSREGPAHRRIFTMGALNGLLQYYTFEVDSCIGSGFFPLVGISGRIMACVDKRHATNIIIKARKFN